MALTSKFWQALAAADVLRGEKQAAFAKAVQLSPAQLSRLKRHQISPTPEEQARIFARFDALEVPIAKADRTAAFFSPYGSAGDVQKLVTGSIRKNEDARVTKLAVEIVGRLAADPDMAEGDRVELVKKYMSGRWALGLDRLHFGPK